MIVVSIFYAGHPVLLALLFVGTCVGFSLAGLLISKRYVAKESLEISKDGIIAYMNVVALLFAVLLAFLVIAVWENYEKNQNNVSDEANYLGSLYRNINTLPDTMRIEFHKELEAYKTAVVTIEWFSMEKGNDAKEVRQVIVQVFNSIAKYDKTNERRDIIFGEVYKEFNAMFDCRRNRLIACGENLPSVLWLVLIMGMVATIFFSYYFYIEPFKVHIIFTVVLGIVIGLTLFLVFILEHPFHEPWKISSDVFEKVHLIVE